METPFDDHSPSPKFIEDLKRYQAKRLETWHNSTILIRRLIVHPNGKPRVIYVRTLKPEEEKEPRPHPNL